MPNPFENVFGAGGENVRESLWGPSEAMRMQRERQAFDRAGVAEANARSSEQRSAQAAAYRRVAQMREAQPTAPSQQLLMQWLNDPEPGGYPDVSSRAENNIDPTFIQNILTQITPQPTTLGAGQKQVMPNQTDINGPSTEIASNEKPMPTQRIVAYGEPGSEKFNMKPGDQLVIEETMGQDGTPAVTGIKKLGGDGITVNNNAAVDTAYKKDLNAAALKRSEDYNKKVVSTVSMVEQADRIQQQVEKTGASGIGLAGVISQVASAGIAQSREAMKAAGLPVDAEAYNWAPIQGVAELGPKAAAIKTNIMGFAYDLAASQAHGVVTQKDVNAAIEQIGGWMGDPAQLNASLQELIQRNVKQIATQHDLDGPSYEGTDVRSPRDVREILTSRGYDKYLPRAVGTDDVFSDQKAGNGQQVPPIQGGPPPKPEEIDAMSPEQLQQLNPKALPPVQFESYKRALERVKKLKGKTPGKAGAASEPQPFQGGAREKQ